MKQKYIFLFILITFISMMTACKDPATQAEVSPLPPIKIDEPSTPVPITDSSEPADNSLEPTPCSPTNPYIEERLGFTGSNIAAGGLIAGDGENWVYYLSFLFAEAQIFLAAFRRSVRSYKAATVYVVPYTVSIGIAVTIRAVFALRFAVLQNSALVVCPFLTGHDVHSLVSQSKAI